MISRPCGAAGRRAPGGPPGPEAGADAATYETVPLQVLPRIPGRGYGRASQARTKCVRPARGRARARDYVARVGLVPAFMPRVVLTPPESAVNASHRMPVLAWNAIS